MKLRFATAALAVTVAWASACASTQEVEARRAPSWIAGGETLAKELRAKKSNSGDDDQILHRVTQSTTTTVVGANLPDEAIVVAALKNYGLNEEAAKCIYDGVAGTALADKVGDILTAATSSGSATKTASLLDEGTQKQLLVVMAPCLDTNTLVALMGSLLGSKTSGSTSSVAQLTTQLSKALSGTTTTTSIAALQKALASTLSSAQVQQLVAAVKALQSAQNFTLDVSSIDFSKIDTSNLTIAQIVAIISAVAKGLTAEQLAQLAALAKIDLSSLNSAIDLTKLSQSAGSSALLGVLATLLGGGLSGSSSSSSNTVTITIDKNTDLSLLNPFAYINQDALNLLLTSKYGLSSSVASCLYNEIGSLDTTTVYAIMQGTDASATAKFLFIILGCITG